MRIVHRPSQTKASPDVAALWEPPISVRTSRPRGRVAITPTSGRFKALVFEVFDGGWLKTSIVRMGPSSRNRSRHQSRVFPRSSSNTIDTLVYWKGIDYLNVYIARMAIFHATPGWIVDVPPRVRARAHQRSLAAFSHSYSMGSLHGFPVCSAYHAAYARAERHETMVTGCRGRQ